jgi:ATP-dependent helicase/nuclease subunit B
LKILGHHDPTVLERELLARVAASHERAPQAAPILVVVPTARLGEHVQRRLVETGRTWLGVEVLHFRALAHRILAAAGVAAPRLLSVRLREALLRRVLREAPANSWTRFVALRPGTLGPLLGSLDELREAGIDAAAVRAAAAGDARAADLGEIHAGYEAALERLLPRGFADDAALSRLASKHAAAYARHCRDVMVHGVYELVGVQLDLLRALDAERAVTVLLPASTAAHATAYARDFARQWLLAAGEAIEPVVLEDPQEKEREPVLAALYDETATPTPAGSLRFLFSHAQGAAAEVRAAVREALVAVRGGCPPHEIAFVVRDLAVHGAAFEETLEEQALPWTTSASVPLRRAPVVHDLMVLLEALRDDFPRRPTAEILRSRRIRWDRLAGSREDAPHGDRADRFSRKAGIVGGLDEWTKVLEAWAAAPRSRDERTEEDPEIRAERVNEARRIGAALVALQERLRPGRPRRYTAHADALERFVDELLVRRDEPALDGLLAILQEMRDLDQVVGEERDVPFGEMFAWLDEAVDSASLAPRRRDGGGVRVLDAMQFRGLTCRRLFLLGMNSGRLPRPPRLDPILTDELRGRISEATGRPLPIKGRGDLEERLLLGLVVGAAREDVRVSWQRADESGRATTPSLALRELARISSGRPHLTGLLASAVHVPSHPRAWLEALARTRILEEQEERLLSVLRASAPVAYLDTWYPDLGPGLAMVRATEEFRPGRDDYDGRVGPLGVSRVFSVSELARLGECPLKFFFSAVLRVRALDQEARLFEMDARDLGNCVHLLLERLYRELAAEGLFEAGREEAARRFARERLRALWPAALEPLIRSSRLHAPVLLERFEERWLRSLDAFLDDDLGLIHAERRGAPATEIAVERTLELGAGVRFPVRGRFDRRFDTPQGPVVGDYKTGQVEDLDDPTAMLKGQKLQVPLYWMLAEPAVTVEVLGIGPKHDKEDSSGTRLSFRGFDTPGHAREGFLETLRILAQLVERGIFPLHPSKACRWCDYSSACREAHPPTLEREEASADSRLFRMLGSKSVTKLPLLPLLEEERP